MSPDALLADFDASLRDCPIIAILRGLEPSRAIEVGDILYQAGLRILEVPLNSPDPLESIEALAKHFAGRAIIGAGTVLTPNQAEAVKATGGQLVVSPNTNVQVIKRTKELGMISLPGCLTPSEAFSALDAGADGLKLFPGEAITPSVLTAMRAVLPSGVRILVVGGVNADTMAPYLATGASGFGIGSSLFKPNYSATEIQQRADCVIKHAAE